MLCIVNYVLVRSATNLFMDIGATKEKEGAQWKLMVRYNTPFYLTNNHYLSGFLLFSCCKSYRMDLHVGIN